MTKPKQIEYHFYQSDRESLIKKLGKETLLDVMREMLLIRNFETRAESAYQQGKIGGFFHAYIGQEAIQTAAVRAMGRDNWWATTYRCHALALLTGATPNEIMAELFGRSTGNARGRGGSMHLYTDRLLGGFGIVGGHLPIATGAAFSLKYLDDHKRAAICFLGEGAVVQGAVHESLNLAALWNLPCIYVIENNQWGMGTAVHRAIAAQPIAEHLAKAYDIESYTVDGTDFFSCYAAFAEIFEKVKKTQRPVLVEMITERFRGHSISDPALYRSKDLLKNIQETKDPIKKLLEPLMAHKMLSEAEFEEMNRAQREIAIAAMKYADESPWPDLSVLGEDVFAP